MRADQEWSGRGFWSFTNAWRGPPGVPVETSERTAGMDDVQWPENLVASWSYRRDVCVMNSWRACSCLRTGRSPGWWSPTTRSATVKVLLRSAFIHLAITASSSVSMRWRFHFDADQLVTWETLTSCRISCPKQPSQIYSSHRSSSALRYREVGESGRFQVQKVNSPMQGMKLW